MLKKTSMLLLFIALSFGAATAQAKTIEVEGLDGLKFSKESITVKAGEKVTIKLVNKTELPPSAMAHNMLILATDATAQKINQAATKAGAGKDYIPADMDEQILAHTSLVAGGESDTVTFTAPSKPGKHDYICTFPGHFAAGMKGTLTVEAE